MENCSERNAEIVKDHINNIQVEDGRFSQLKFWKLKQKLWAKTSDPPMAKYDENGVLVTAPDLLKTLYLNTYKNRLRNRKMKEDLIDIFFLKEKLWESRMKELRKKKTKPWDITDLRKALKKTKEQ